MADYRNWDEQRSNDWNDSGKRRGRDDERNRYRSRQEGYGYSDWNRSRENYHNQGNSYDDNRYGSEYDQNRGSDWGNSGYNNEYGGSGSNYNRDFNRTSRRGDNWGSSYGDTFDSYIDYNRQNRGGAGDYRNQGSYSTGSYGTGSGMRNRAEGYGGGFGFGERGNFGDDRNYGYSQYRDRQRDYSRGSYDRNRSGNDERTWWDKTADEVSSWFGDEDAERRRRQDRSHKGRGPKNYQRSDERIKEDINDRLSDDWFINASEVEVSVTNGEVTITGTVDDRSDKRRAEDIAESVSGVKHVENRLRVSSGQDKDRSTPGAYTSTQGAASIGTATTTEGAYTPKSKSSYADSK